jgi:hypothetical protein
MAWPTATSPSTTRAPIAPSTLRSWACAQTAPKPPVLAAMTATVLSRMVFVAIGRDTRSTASGKIVLKLR